MTQLKMVKIVVLKESSMWDSIPQSSSFREETFLPMKYGGNKEDSTLWI